MLYNLAFRPLVVVPTCCQHFRLLDGTVERVGTFNIDSYSASNCWVYRPLSRSEIWMWAFFLRATQQFRLSVRPSVCHTRGLHQKRLNVSSKCFHCLIGPSFYFYATKGLCVGLNLTASSLTVKFRATFNSGTEKRRFSVPLLMTWCHQIDHPSLN